MKLPFLLSAAAALAAVLVSPPAAADDLQIRSRPGQRGRLVELYTSEGCSSCPPAEAWLSRLAASPRLWTELVPVAFHVDYWDNLGWRDRFASPGWSQRQRAYAAAWGRNSVYTPGFVLDGREWPRWGDQIPAASGPADPGQLTATVRARRSVSIAYAPAVRPAARREASVALLGFNLNSDVRAGENRGRSLWHDFVVLSCETKPLAGSSVDFALPAAPRDAARLALAAWISEPGGASIEQAAGGWLPAAEH